MAKGWGPSIYDPINKRPPKETVGDYLRKKAKQKKRAYWK